MKRSSQILLVIASLSLIGSYFFPIWQIRLEAPQFPRGLFLQIELFDIHGTDEYMLDNINILNHYIGMHKIHPEDFPELKIMPYIVGFLILSGLIVALLKKNKLLTVWLILFAIFGLVGMYDFYSWEFAYGHDLNPKAPIKIQGMAYQPPLIGQKDLLNFRAFSFPYIGAVFLMFSVMVGIIVNIREYLFMKKRKKSLTKIACAILILAVSFTFQQCATPQPKPILAGQDACVFCKMTIADKRYGAELVTKKGKVYKYDSIECLIRSVYDDKITSEDNVLLLLGIDFSKPGVLEDATKCHYLHSMNLPSPMGMFLTCFKNEENARTAKEEYTGEILDWNQSKNLVLSNK